MQNMLYYYGIKRKSFELFVNLIKTKTLKIMKKFLFSLLVVVMGITISTKNVSAQCTNSDSVNIDSVYRTHNSISAWMHVYGSTENAFRCLSYGLNLSYNTWNTTFTSTAPTVDGIFIITINGLLPNTQYSIQAKLLGSASCASDPVTVTTASCPFSPSISGLNQTCSGISTILTASPSGGTNYVWKRNGIQVGTGINYNASITGSYTCDVTLDGCTSTSSNFSFQVNGLPNASISPTSATFCSGGSIVLNASGGESYSWSPATGLNSTTGASVTASPTSTTIYTVTATDANSCTASATCTVNVVQPQAINVVPSSSTICHGKWVTLTVSGVDLNDLTYSWLPDTGLNQPTGASVIASPVATTIYTVVATNFYNGCTSRALALVNVNQLPNAVVTGVSPICAGTSDTISASAGAGYSYEWSTGDNTQFFVDTPLANMNYTVTVTDQNGCQKVGAKTIIVDPAIFPTISGSSHACFGETATLTVTPSGTAYQWYKNGSLISGATNSTYTANVTGIYSVRVTDDACVATSPDFSFTVISNPVVTVVSPPPICFSDSAQLVALGDATNFSWLPVTGLSNPNISNPKASPAVTTTYTVTGNNGLCSKDTTITITVNPLPTVNAGVDRTVCAGTPVALTGTGTSTLTFVWNNGVVNGTPFIPLATETYTLIGTDSKGCENTDQVTVTVNPNPMPIASATDSVCSGISTTVNATGGYDRYLWNTGDTTATFVAILPVGTNNLFVTVTDMNGCVATASTSAVVNPNPVMSIITSSDTICAETSLMLIAQGAALLNWTGGLGTNDTVFATPAITTNYSVTGTNLVGCTGIATINVTVNPNPTVNAFASLNAICLGNSTVLSATGADLCSWSNGANGDSISVSPTVTTDYFVIGFTNGCTGIDTVTVMVNPNPIVSITASNNPICNGASTSLSAIGAQTCSWSTGQTGSLITVSPTVSTNYFVIGTDTNGCVGVSSGMLITVNSLPAITVSALPSVICEGSHTQLSASGGISYSWSPINSSGQTVTANPSSTTTYVVTGLNINGCTNTAAVTVQVDPAVHLTTGGDQTICEGSSGVYISASNASSYHWSPTNLVSNGNIANTFAFPDTTTIFSVVGTAGTCSDTAFVLVSVIDNPLVDSVYYDLSNGMLYIEGLLQNLAFIRIGSVVYLPFSVSNTNAWFTNVNLINGQGIYVENASGCSYFFPYEDVSGISSETLPVEVSVYPNPFSEKFFVELPDGKYNVSLTNVSGQIVREMSASGNFEIHGEDLSSGIYFLNISSGEGNYLTKLIKN